MLTAIGYLFGVFAYIVLFGAVTRAICLAFKLCRRNSDPYRASKHTRSMHTTLIALTGGGAR